MGDLAVTVLDHGPWGYPDRALDLSLEAFREIVGPVGIGVASVQYRVVSEP
jgi:rare lipoprotein A (peptidoglycan hydrolase)